MANHHGSKPGAHASVIEFVQRAQRVQREIDGTFPEGHLCPDDEGAIQFAIGIDRGQVKLVFPKPVHWLAMSPEQARELADKIHATARKAALSSGVVKAMREPQ